MPYHKTSYKLGNMFVKFKITFPKQIDQNQIQSVQQTLSGLEGMNKNLEDDVNVNANELNEEQNIKYRTKEEIRDIKNLESFQPAQRNTHHQGGTKGVDIDEDNV